MSSPRPAPHGEPRLARILAFISSRLGADARRRKVYNADGTLDAAALDALFREAAEATRPAAPFKGNPPDDLAEAAREKDHLERLLSGNHHKDTPDAIPQDERLAAEERLRHLREDLLLAAACRWLDRAGF